jgi:hypothetical protein
VELQTSPPGWSYAKTRMVAAPAHFRLIRAQRSFTPTMRQLLTRTARRGDTQRVALVRDALRLLGILVAYPVSQRPVRPLAEEAMRSLPGDELAAGAKIRWNHATGHRGHGGPYGC